MARHTKFYTDEHISKAIVQGLRSRGVDVASVPEMNMQGKTDVEHLERARIEERVMVTCDHDFLKLHSQGIAHAGIAFTSQETRIGDVIRGLMLIHDLLEPADMICRIEFIA